MSHLVYEFELGHLVFHYNIFVMYLILSSVNLKLKI